MSKVLFDLTNDRLRGVIPTARALILTKDSMNLDRDEIATAGRTSARLTYTLIDDDHDVNEARSPREIR